MVSFGLPYFASDNASLSHRFNVQPVVGYSQNLAVGGIQESIITLYGWGNPLTYIENNGGTLTVSKQNSRAMEVDEPINTSLHISNKGNIILNEQMTVGMEARGAQVTNTADVTNHNTYLSNDGTIIGNGGFKNQAGLSIGSDGSVTGTAVVMVNRQTGNITMNSPESIGIQLRPDQFPVVMQGFADDSIQVFFIGIDRQNAFRIGGFVKPRACALLFRQLVRRFQQVILNRFKGFVSQVIGAAVRVAFTVFRQPVSVVITPIPSVRRPIAPRLAAGIG